MDIIHAGILGIIEGLTEFLPISSTFHLIWTSKLLGISQTDFAKLFEVVVQAGAILSLVFLYTKTFLEHKDLAKKTIVSFIPTAIVGLLLYKIIKNVFFENNILMLAVFIGMGILFILYEWYIQKKNIQLNKTLENFTYKQAILIGFIQALAIIPGVSRAGAVILGMMFLKFRRDESAKFSFLLALPTVVAASVLDLFKMRKLIISSSDHMILLTIGFVFSFIAGYIVVKWFIKFLQHHSLTVFGWYRIVVGFLLIIFRV